MIFTLAKIKKLNSYFFDEPLYTGMGPQADCAFHPSPQCLLALVGLGKEVCGPRGVHAPAPKWP